MRSLAGACWDCGASTPTPDVLFCADGCTALHATHHHKIHGLTCDEFDALIARAESRCEICRARPEPIGPLRQASLSVDHDHERAYRSDVRGLVCAKCNAALRFIDAGERAPNEAQAAYLANPWHPTQEPEGKES